MVIRKEYKHAKSKLSNVEAYNIVKRLNKNGAERKEIAEALKDAGYVGTKTGKPVTPAGVSNMLLRQRKAKKAVKLQKMAPPPKNKTNSLVKAILKETSVSAEDRIVAALALLG